MAIETQSFLAVFNQDAGAISLREAVEKVAYQWLPAADDAMLHETRQKLSVLLANTPRSASRRTLIERFLKDVVGEQEDRKNISRVRWAA